jgi:hypothetical protein
MPKAPELIAHEMEHILEQLEGVDLQARGGVVWKSGDTAFETSRAIEAGRQAAREVTNAACREESRGECRPACDESPVFRMPPSDGAAAPSNRTHRGDVFMKSPMKLAPATSSSRGTPSAPSACFHGSTTPPTVFARRRNELDTRARWPGRLGRILRPGLRSDAARSQALRGGPGCRAARWLDESVPLVSRARRRLAEDVERKDHVRSQDLRDEGTLAPSFCRILRSASASTARPRQLTAPCSGNSSSDGA